MRCDVWQNKKLGILNSTTTELNYRITKEQTQLNLKARLQDDELSQGLEEYTKTKYKYDSCFIRMRARTDADFLCRLQMKR